MRPKKGRISRRSSPENERGITRRELLKGVINAGAAAVLSGCTWVEKDSGGVRRKSVLGKTDLIRRENEKPGTRDWLLTNTRIDPKTKYRCPWIEGYCSRASVRAGESIGFNVSTNPPSPFTLDIYRMGYYGGAGGRHMSRLGPFKGVTQPDPPVGEKRVRDRQWEPCARIKIPKDWLSGVYLGKLTAERDGLQSYVIFIVRDDRPADFIFQCSDTTWLAYNRWPSQFALYDDGDNQWYWGPNVQVSFNRPYGKYCQILDAPISTGSGEWFLWEFPLAYWLESRGADVTYISNLDTRADPKGLLRAKGLLSVGHDEYYSIEMFNHVRTAIEAGLNVAFLSGTPCCGRLDPRPGTDGRRPDRIFSRVDRYGPKDPEEVKHFPAMALLPHASPNERSLV